MLRPLRACCASLIVLSLIGCAEPPHKEMNQAQGAIDAARAAGADQYALTELTAATDLLKRSEDAVAQYDYRLALSLAIESRERAQDAAKTAGETRAKARGDAERVVAEVNSELTQVRRRFDADTLAKLPRRTANDLRSVLTAADKSMQEARAALAQDDYQRAMALAKTVSSEIREVLVALEKAPADPPSRKRR